MQQWKRMNPAAPSSMEKCPLQCLTKKPGMKVCILALVFYCCGSNEHKFSSYSNTHLLSHSCIGQKCSHGSTGSCAQHLTRCLLCWGLICSSEFSSSFFRFLAELSSQRLQDTGPIFSLVISWRLILAPRGLVSGPQTYDSLLLQSQQDMYFSYFEFQEAQSLRAHPITLAYPG